MIGNDIVSKADLKRREGEKKERYYQKTYTENEFRLIKTLSIQNVEGFFWALKESAYKAYFRLKPERINSPKKFEVLELKKNKAKVNTPAGLMLVDIEETNDYFHAIAMPLDGIATTKEVFVINEDFHAELKQHLDEHFGTSVIIQKNENNVPMLWVENMPYLLSLSHDGKWGAYALCPFQ